MTRKILPRLLAIGLAAAWSTAALAQQPAISAPIRVVLKAAEEEPQVPLYWIGISLRDADPALLAQLKLEHAVAVGDVVPDSPAAKAGLKKHDLIIKAGDSAIKEGADLLKAVGEAKDSEMSLVLIRNGAEQTVRVTPVKRPQDQIGSPVPASPAVEGNAREGLERAWKAWRDRAGQGAIEMDVLGPAVLMQAQFPPLPEDIKITVQREGKKLAKVTVEKADRGSWTATEKELDTLPAEYREFARMMLGQQRHEIGANEGNYSVVPAGPKMRVREFREDPLSRIEQELKELRRDVEELRKNSSQRQGP